MSEADQDAAHVLVVDDEVNVRRVLGALLEQQGYRVSRAAEGGEALRLVRLRDPDAIITDLSMPGMGGMDLLTALTRDFPEIPVIVLTAHGSVGNAVEAMRRGAFDFMTKPFDREDVAEVLSKSLKQAGARREEVRAHADARGVEAIVGEAPEMRELCDAIVRVASAPSTVLILGETGSGKELVADALHAHSPRRAAPLVKINCAALPAPLLESELFGHEKDAFTGAGAARPGRFQLADRGTLFLDEIGELPPPAQAKILRAIELGEVQPLGSPVASRVDVRLVAATHRDLAAEVDAGRFREDLYFRLRVVELRVPPLRERLEDLPMLVEFFLERHASRLEIERPALEEGVLEVLARHGWPGNVRELENACERALLLARGERIAARDLLVEAPGEETLDLKGAAREAAEDAERRLIRAALAATAGNVTHAARQLGLSRRGLQMKMAKLGLRERDEEETG